MVILADSREKWTQSPNAKAGRNVRDYFEKHKVEYIVTKLDVGDYMIPGGHISVDRKGSLEEMATNLLNRSDSARFWREVRRSRQDGIKLIVLIECGSQYRTIRDISKWKSKHSPVTGRSMMDEMTRLEYAYGVQFRFCDKRSTGKRIIELLGEEEQT